MTDTPVVNDIPAILERADAATPGPWYEPRLSDGVRHLERNEDWYFEDVPPGYNLPGRQDGDGGGRDGAFIAHSRTDVPSMAAEILSLRARLREIAVIIESVDNRAMAADGPVTPTLQEITQREMSRIYTLSRREKENG